jgi:hypothetical protein
MPLRDRELTSPPPTLSSLQELSGPALIAMLIAAYAGKSANEIAEAVAQAAIKRHGGEPRDDIAILVLNRRRAG